MMRRLRLTLLVALMSVARAPVSAQAATSDTQLTVAQREALEQGKPVQLLQSVSSSPWPRSVVFQFIDATPEECAAVLSDYALQASYIPRLNSSRVVATRGARETDVEYVIDIPVFADEKSVSRQDVSLDQSAYRIDWHTVVSDSTPSGSLTTGRATFTPMRNGRLGRVGTLMVHDQTVVPSSVFAKVPFVRNKGVESSRDAAHAIAAQVERERHRDRDLLARQIARLRDALASRPDTGKVIPDPHPER